MNPTLVGSLLALCTMTIWSGWNVVTRLGVVEALTVWDITFLRFATAGTIALPLVWRYRRLLLEAPPLMLLLMAAGAGVPYVLVASFGFNHAPAAHGVLIPGTMTVWVAILSALWLNEKFSPSRIAGYMVIAATITYRIASHANELEYLVADGYFVTAALFWAIYTVVNKVVGLKPIAAVAFISFASLVGFCVPYAALNFEHVRALPIGDAMLQIVYQGVVVSFVALTCYNKAMHHLGAARASAFAALIPLLTTLMGMPLLGEYPRQQDMVFVLLLTFGVLLATGFVRLRRG